MGGIYVFSVPGRAQSQLSKLVEFVELRGPEDRGPGLQVEFGWVWKQNVLFSLLLSLAPGLLKLLEKEGQEGSVLCCSPSHFTHQDLGVWRACLPPARAPHRWRPARLCITYMCVLSFPLPCQFLSSLCLGSPQLPPSPVHPCHLIFPKTYLTPLLCLRTPQPTGEARSPLQSAPDTLSRVLNSQCLELFSFCCHAGPDPCLCMVRSQVVWQNPPHS